MRMILLLLASLGLVGCVSIDPYTGTQKTSNTAKGAGMGALAGAVVGAATSGTDNRAEATVLGALAGGAIGGGAGYYMDRQEAQLRQRREGTGVRVQRNGEAIRLVMPGNITFDVSSYDVKSHFHPVLDSVALVVDEFDKTAINVSGFTDSSGSFEYNQSLSERRADSVANYLIRQGVKPGRLHASGYGPRQPVASNDTPMGRETNRRVEIDLVPM